MYFDILEIPKPNIQAISKGAVEIVEDQHGFILLNNGIRWMTYNREEQNQYDQFYSSYDLAYGDVLISGLGFGLLAYWLASKPEVTSVTVVEVSRPVIDIFRINNPVIPEKIKIVHANIIMYNAGKSFDGLFLDHYETQTINWRIKNMLEIGKRIQHSVFWAWSLEFAYLNYEYQLPYDDSYGLTQEYLTSHDNKLNEKWQHFVTTHLPTEPSLLEITPAQLNKYIESFFYMDRQGNRLEA